MIVKRYADGTYNIIYEKGDHVKVKDVSKYGEQENEHAKEWGEVVSVSGNPLTAKLLINTDDGQIEEYVFNVVPTDENGNELTEEQIMENETISETKIDPIHYKQILKFNEFPDI